MAQEFLVSSLYLSEASDFCEARLVSNIWWSTLFPLVSRWRSTQTKRARSSRHALPERGVSQQTSPESQACLSLQQEQHKTTLCTERRYWWMTACKALFHTLTQATPAVTDLKIPAFVSKEWHSLLWRVKALGLTWTVVIHTNSLSYGLQKFVAF